MTSTQLEKTYDCLTCKAPIKLARKEDGTGWEKFNLDGSPHTHPAKKVQQQQQQQFQRSELADLQDEVSELKAQIKNLITQVQMMRQELKK